MKISVFGIGYVGAVTSACLVESGHEVIAVDKDPVKVRCIEEGRAPIIEAGLADLIAKGRAAGRLNATIDAGQAVRDTDISLVCVGTPSREDGSLNLDYVRGACEEIGAALARKSSYHCVVMRSTMVPGSAMKTALPALEQSSNKKAGADFGFGNNPEFLREGSAIADYYDPPKIVIGAMDEKTAQAVSSLYHGIKAPEIFTSIEVAEGVKYADNAWHAMKVGFANEIGNIMKEHGIDSHDVMDIFFQDKKLNISTAYLKPGFAFGGSCLPKDVRALRASAKAKGLHTPIFDSLLAANDEQIARAFRMIVQSGHKNIGLLGLAFKAGTDDLRESPLVKLAAQLLEAGYSLKIYDTPVIAARHMDGANKTYITQVIPHIAACLVEKPEDLTASSDLVVIGNPGKDFYAILEAAGPHLPIIDLVRLDRRLEKRAHYKGLCW